MKALSKVARIAVVTVCAGVCLGCVFDLGHQSAQAAQAGDQPLSFVVHGDGCLPAPDAAAIDYAKDLGTSTGASLTLALSFSLATAPWDEAVQTISDAEPDNYAGAYRTGVLDAGAHIAFVRQPSAATVTILDALPIDTTVVVGSPASAQALADAANSADTIVKTVGLTPLSTDTDTRSSTITVKVASGGTSAQMQSGRTAVAKAVATIVGNSRIRTDVVTGGAGDTYTALSAITGGGKDLDTNTSPPKFDCISGFATSQGGTNGVTTAKHCANSLLWGDKLGYISYVGPESDAGSTNGTPNEIDLQFHRTINGYTASPTFYATGTSSSDIKSVDVAQNAVVGDYVNKFGRKGGYVHGCQVSQLNFPADYASDDGQQHHFVGSAKVSTTGPNCLTWQGGDSGGPVWSADGNITTARGSVSAGSNDGTSALYVPQTRWSSNLSASVIADN